jgi:GTP-binding protein
MRSIYYPATTFLKSANHSQQFPSDDGQEVAFGGRSNAGKSSALNVIAGIHRLARTSKTPGRTQLINFFQIGPSQRLVDLPGYGYAKVPPTLKAHWGTLISEYITQRNSLRGIVLLMDVRHPLTPLDQQMIEWGLSFNISLHILLTKADKLTYGAAKNTLLSLLNALPKTAQLSAQLFSAINARGVNEARNQLDQWLRPA